jgi:hypothetical protein
VHQAVDGSTGRHNPLQRHLVHALHPVEAELRPVLWIRFGRMARIIIRKMIFAGFPAIPA